MKDRVLDGQNIKGSKFLFVMAVAKRSKQINKMAKERGLPCNQVATVKSKYIKAPTIALSEILEGNIDYNHEEKKSIAAENDSRPEEPSGEPEDSQLPEEEAVSN